MGSFEKITHYLRLYLDMHPGDTSVKFSLAALYMKDGRRADAQKTLRDVLSLQPEHKDATNLLEEVERGLAKVKQTEVTGK